MDLSDVIRNVPDFPKAGVQFKDITTLVLHPQAFAQVIDVFAERYETNKPDAILAVESRGFVFGGALAVRLGLPFIMARKPGKLPADTLKESFDLEYGSDSIEIHEGAVTPGWRVLILDDLLATGGTVTAASRLVQRAGGTVQEAAFVIELLPLGGREALAPLPVFSQITFHVDE
ncbi:MAG: adenine phosphoribosyltransferase [Candidatus Hydrogenedens sp.]|jgi:adenine phosphoribosyltransferase|nr:adenine phosphoribosyltransferase [Candidatus Hydrogenedens sp.]